MKLITKLCLALCWVLAGSVAVADEHEAQDIAEMVSKGKVSVDFRYRYEGVDQDGFDDDAEASTLRTRLTLQSAPFHGVDAKIEMDDVREVGPDDYNSTVNGKTEYPVVADPEGTDLNQFWLRYRSSFDSTLGRQRILHGNQRFVGGVAFRQNEQTFDALRFDLMQWEDLRLDFAYVDQVNRIFGPDDGANPAELDGDNVFIRADYQLNEQHKVAGFGYFLDFDEQSDFAPGKTVNNSSDTWGLEYQGKFDSIQVDLAWATQSDAGDSTLDYDADYSKFEIAFKAEQFRVNGGIEILEGDNGVGFATPLATLHKFQGWADVFLTTPGDGIEDVYFGVTGKAGEFSLGAFYHDFQAEASSDDYGSEIDLMVAYPLDKNSTLKAEFASFDSDDSDLYADVDKFWLTFQVKLQ